MWAYYVLTVCSPTHKVKCRLIEYRSDDVMAFCYSIVMVPNKRSLHQASGSGLEWALVLLATIVITDPRTA